jgi:hypothetical protein
MVFNMVGRCSCGYHPGPAFVVGAMVGGGMVGGQYRWQGWCSSLRDHSGARW